MARNPMKPLYKIFLSVFLVLVILSIGFSFLTLRKALFAVYDVPDQYAYAPANADLTIVDFNKYGCPHCQVLHPVLWEAIKRDGRVRYLPRPVTYQDAWEETLITAVYAAGAQGKFIDMHHMIYENWPINSRKALFDHARALGLDTEKLSRDMTHPEIKKRMDENFTFFQKWGLKRTPTLLMGGKALYTPTGETPTIEMLLEKFEEARS